MKISDVKVTLSGEDILSIFNEFVSVEGLDIKSILIDDEIRFNGSFTKGITINFEGSLKLGHVDNGKIYANITGFKVMKVGIFSYVRKLALKYALKSFSDMGILVDHGNVIVNLKKILEDVPFVDFDIADLTINNNTLIAEVNNINLSIKGDLIKEKEPEPKTDEEIEQEKILAIAHEDKIHDAYTVGRVALGDKLPQKAKKYSDYIFVLPDLVALIYRLLKDSRVSMKTKLVISGAVAYIVVPTDIIPDKIPFIGKIDELAVAFFALNVIISEVPLNIIVENWEGQNDIILVVRNVIEYATNFTGAKNVDKLYKFVEDLVTV